MFTDDDKICVIGHDDMNKLREYLFGVIEKIDDENDLLSDDDLATPYPIIAIDNVNTYEYIRSCIPAQLERNIVIATKLVTLFENVEESQLTHEVLSYYLHKIIQLITG